MIGSGFCIKKYQVDKYIAEIPILSVNHIIFQSILFLGKLEIDNAYTFLKPMSESKTFSLNFKING